MPDSDGQTTKTAVIENEVHEAIALYADVEDETIQGFINETLRESETVEQFREVADERDRLLRSNSDLSEREAEARALEKVL